MARGGTPFHISRGFERNSASAELLPPRRRLGHLCILNHRRIAAARERRAARRDLEQDLDADVGALLVGVFIFGLAYVYNYSGMAACLAKAFSSIGAAFTLISIACYLFFPGIAKL
jgi:hypothetical protein